LAPGLREIPTLPVEGGEGVFVGVVNPESVPLGRELRYYFTMKGPEGRTACSDVFRLYPEAQLAGGDPAAAPHPAGQSVPAVEPLPAVQSPPAAESTPALTPSVGEPKPAAEEIATP
jgi:hypothetical protein